MSERSRPRPPRRAAGAPASPMQERKRQLVRDELARVAWKLFDRGGYEATTVEQIAEGAGISRRSFFRYYSSKEDVVVGTSAALAEDFLAAFRKRPASEPPLLTIRRVRESPTRRRAMMERHARMEERLAALLARRLRADPRRDPTPALLAF